MLISRPRIHSCFAVGLVLAASLISSAGGAEHSTSTAQQLPSANAAFHLGLTAIRSGKTLEALSALQDAAEQGHTLAQWRLAVLYEQGSGVEQSDAKAFRYYQLIASQNSEESADGPLAPIIADSFVKLGAYYQAGVAGSNIAPQPERAFNLWNHAATYYGDPRAQYALAKLYLTGQGIQRNPRRAVQWLFVAARKHNVAAQCELGRILLTGAPGVKALPATGRMWLEIARRKATTSDQQWIIDAHTAGFAGLSDAERERAITMADQWLKQEVATH